MKIFEWCCEFDEHLIDHVFQPAADWLKSVTNRSCFWWGARLLELTAILVFGKFVSKVLDNSWNIVGAIATLIFITWTLNIAWMVQRTLPGANPWRILYRVLRLLFLADVVAMLLLIVLFSDRYFWPDDISMTLGLYLIACRGDGGHLFRQPKAVPQAT